MNSEKFAGQISEVRVTKGVARYLEESRLRFRLRVLWSAIKYVFTGRSVWMMGGMHLYVGEAGITTEAWIKKDEQTPVQHWAVTFDGERAQGYIDGVQKGGA